jgi:hypothetical protein
MLKGTSKVLTIAVFFAAIFFGLTHVMAIEDWLKLRNYTPPTAVAALAGEDAMTDYARHVFYVNHPQLENNVSLFRQKCALAEKTIVLGCYHSNQRGIDVYDVKDSRLNGVQEVTAAHEMLHAAYDRLSSSERKKVDAMMVNFYNNGLNDERVKKTIDSYKKTEPDDVVNEMHSVFGTEVANLPAPMEAYYKKYFIDRAKVTAFEASYEGEFTNRLAQIDADDQTLAGLKSSIEDQERSLESQLQSLQSDRSRVESSGSQAEVNSYNARVSSYNSAVRRLQSDIAEYNNLVKERNAIAAELKSLQSSLDTRLTQQ